MKQHQILLGLTAALLGERPNAWHLATYFALVKLFKQSKYDGPFSVSRRKVMKLARMNTAPTYHKYIDELQHLGYIQYTPSYHPKSGSLIKLF